MREKRTLMIRTKNTRFRGLKEENKNTYIVAHVQIRTKMRK